MLLRPDDLVNMVLLGLRFLRSPLLYRYSFADRRFTGAVSKKVRSAVKIKAGEEKNRFVWLATLSPFVDIFISIIWVLWC